MATTTMATTTRTMTMMARWQQRRR
jgi:hypothetical protein